MSDKKLLREWYGLETKPGIVKESREKHDGKLVLNGIIQAAGKLNKNGRIYPESVLRREMENYMLAIREGRALGECDHPDSRSTVNLKETSHRIIKAWWDGQNVMGEIEILPTPNGKILETLIDSGVTLGTSSRGLGSVKQTNEGQMVEDDYQLICYDIVSEPSTHGAFLREGVEFDPRKTWSRADRIYRALNEIVRK